MATPALIMVNNNARRDNRNRWVVRASLSIKKGALDTLFIGDYYKWDELSSPAKLSHCLDRSGLM